ncbi:MAG TPA: dihydrofolate reductase family protein [Thermomicrobiales bacterium]|nr:dihydrofolate reductase family protein [Thermomicrobiales bacterium]
MARVIAGMTMSLDGFVSDRNGEVGRLYPDMEAMRQTGQLQEAIRSTGAVVMGRRSYQMGNGDFTGYEFQVPIFVLTHEAPVQVAKGENDKLTFTFVTEGIKRVIDQAKAAAGDKDVTVVGGASTIRQCIKASLADEVHIDLRSILLGDGLRLFDRSGDPPIELESIEVSESPGVTHLRYRIIK